MSSSGHGGDLAINGGDGVDEEIAPAEEGDFLAFFEGDRVALLDQDLSMVVVVMIVVVVMVMMMRMVMMMMMMKVMMMMVECG